MLLLPLLLRRAVSDPLAARRWAPHKPIYWIHPMHLLVRNTLSWFSEMNTTWVMRRGGVSVPPKNDEQALIQMTLWECRWPCGSKMGKDCAEWRGKIGFDVGSGQQILSRFRRQEILWPVTSCHICTHPPSNSTSSTCNSSKSDRAGRN